MLLSAACKLLKQLNNDEIYLADTFNDSDYYNWFINRNVELIYHEEDRAE